MYRSKKKKKKKRKNTNAKLKLAKWRNEETTNITYKTSEQGNYEKIPFYVYLYV